MSDTCRHAVRADLPAIVEALTAGFHEDPLYAWLYPDPAERPARLRETFELVTALALQRGHLYTNRDRTAGAAWTAPDSSLLDTAGEVAFGEMIGRHVGDRLDDVLAGMAATDRHRPAEPHFALHNVAVHAGAQGRGVGAALLGPVLARCDEDGLLAHLDSSSARNVPFYERLGFRVVGETAVPGGGPIMRAMIRPPASGRAPDR